ncbi:MAG: hypothetical protein ACFFCW_32775 [Candidatus Hodarchaeota archaeon]
MKQMIAFLACTGVFIGFAFGLGLLREIIRVLHLEPDVARIIGGIFGIVFMVIFFIAIRATWRKIAAK